MLRVKLGPLAAGAINVALVVPSDESCFEDLSFGLEGPVEVNGRITAAGDAQYYFHGDIGVKASMECRRCLNSVAVERTFEVSVLFAEDEEMTDPSVYNIPEYSAELDLGQMVREETILAMPSFVLCKEDCAGLCQTCGANLNDDRCACERKVDPRWAALEQLKNTLTD